MSLPAVMPLEEFPAEHREHIQALVALPSPPPRWIAIGEFGSIQSRAWFEWHMQRGRDPRRSRRNLPTWLRRRVVERDNYICGLCGGPVDPTDVHIDHVQPVILGGKDTLDNLQVSHSLCNLRKGARPA